MNFLASKSSDFESKQMPRKRSFRVLHFGFDVDGTDVVLDKGGVDVDDDVAASIDVSCRPVPNKPENLLLFQLIPT